MWVDTFKKALDMLKYEKEMRDYNNLSFFKKLLTKKPKALYDKNWKELCTEYTKELQKKYKVQVEKTKYPEIKIGWQHGPLNIEQRAYPIVEFWCYEEGCYFVLRQAFKTNYSTEEWGCPYPYSECGISRKCELSEYEKKYNYFDKIIKEIHKDLVDYLG